MGIRQDILDVIATRAATILVANGYQTNLGSRVYVWKATPFGTNEVPGLDIRDVRDVTISRDESDEVVVQSLDVDLTVIVAAGRTSDDDVRKMIADIYKMIGVDPGWGAKALGTFREDDEMLIDQEEKVIAGAIVRVSVQYATVEFG